MRKYGKVFQRLGKCLLATILIGAAWPTPVKAQNPPTELRTILTTTVANPAARDLAAKEQIKRLVSLGDLRQALALREWREDDPDAAIAAVDRANRLLVQHRFEDAVRAMLRGGDSAGRLAVLDMIAKLSVSVSAVDSKHGATRAFTPDLVDLICHGDGLVKQAAARTLGQVNPDPDVAVPALKTLFRSQQIEDRVAASEALASMIRIVSQLANRNQNGSSSEASLTDVVKVGRSAVELAGRGLGDPQSDVRRRCAYVVGQAADALRKQVMPGQLPEEKVGSAASPPLVNDERAELAPLISALKEQTSRLTHALGDPDTNVRLLARRALEDLTHPQIRLLERPLAVAQNDSKHTHVVLKPSQFIDAAPADSLMQEFQETVKALAAGVSDSDVRARRAAIDVLETLGAAAAPAASSLVQALSDPDLFVRWAAARTLGKISPVEADTAVPALAKLLGDPDADLRLAAITALERYGPAGKSALHDLLKGAGSNDADLRVAALRAIGSIGLPHAKEAIPTFCAALSDIDVRVRLTSAEVLGRFGPDAGLAVGALRKALEDSHPDVQKAAGDALLNVMQKPGR